MLRTLIIALALVATAHQGEPEVQVDRAINCASCPGWNTAREPFRIFGNTYYVGVEGLSAVLITSDEGLILLDGGLPQSAPLIAQSIRRLGFRLQDVRLIVNSHAHYDHAGGISALQRATGATVAASAAGARALRNGQPTPDDPQFAFGPEANGFPAVREVRAVSDNEVVHAGGLAVTGHLTPGHTAGSTTWSWRSCEGAACREMVYADSLNPVSAPGFKFSDDPTRVAEFRRSIARVAGLPCDVLVAVHPQFGEGKSCRTYAAEAATRLDGRLQEEGR